MEKEYSAVSIKNTLIRSKARIAKNKNYYRRQAIVEHPYATIKRQWGYSYILTKKTK